MSKTDLPALPHHPEHSYVWTEMEKRAIAAYAQQCYEAGQRAALSTPAAQEAETPSAELDAAVDESWGRFEAEMNRLKTKKAERVHALVNGGQFPGMSEAFDAHMGASCWIDPAYAPDASTWAAAWKAALGAAQEVRQEPAAPATMRTLTDDELAATIVSALAQARVHDSVWRALTYETGPYDITKPCAAVVLVARAVEAAALAKAAPVVGAAPQPPQPVALPKPDLQADPCSADGVQTDYYSAGTVRRLLAGLQPVALTEEPVLPPGYMLAKLAMVVPLLQEARDALPAITEQQRKAHGISPTLADRMDIAGTYSLDDWRRAHGITGEAP